MQSEEALAKSRYVHRVSFSSAGGYCGGIRSGDCLETGRGRQEPRRDRCDAGSFPDDASGSRSGTGNDVCRHVQYGKAAGAVPRDEGLTADGPSADWISGRDSSSVQAACRSQAARRAGSISVKYRQSVTVQYLHSHAQKSIKNCLRQWDFACWPMFSYGQRSKCADLLNSYDNPLFTIILNRYSLFPEKLGGRNAAKRPRSARECARAPSFYGLYVNNW